MNDHTPSIGHTIWTYKWTFVVIICVMFAITFTGLLLIGFIPDELAVEPSDDGVLSTTSSVDHVLPTQPGFGTATTASATGTKNGSASTTVKNPTVLTSVTTISIPKIGVSANIQNPATTNVYALDELLKKGPIRYPGSGVPGKGNMFLFAHSTSIKVVHNQAYKAFNDLDKLAKGDQITVESNGRSYIYLVRDVTKQNEGEAKVNIADSRNMLTLTTCDTFSGIKQQRIIVEADLDHSYAL